MEFQTDALIYINNEAQSVKHKSLNSTNVFSALTHDILSTHCNLVASLCIYVFPETRNSVFEVTRDFSCMASSWAQCFLFNIIRTKFKLGIVG